MKLSNDHNRPFGMCIGHDNHLVVCNWGSHSLSFIDLDLFGVEDNKLRIKISQFIPILQMDFLHCH